MTTSSAVDVERLQYRLGLKHHNNPHTCFLNINSTKFNNVCGKCVFALCHSEKKKVRKKEGKFFQMLTLIFYLARTKKIC